MDEDAGRPHGDESHDDDEQDRQDLATDYRIFITIPTRLEADDLPAVVCVQFFDDAGNQAPLIREEVPPTQG